ncbi:hypothetical protein FHS10_000570 [Mucilaginibacter dorajii]|nr:hypothetical protein [Mucilaginibacter dorajii]
MCEYVIIITKYNLTTGILPKLYKKMVKKSVLGLFTKK